MLGKIQVRIKTSFGEVVVEEEHAEDLIRSIKALPENFVNELESLISTKAYPTSADMLNGIVEFTKSGPMLVTKARVTHYEAIGLILYASEERTNTASQISRLLQYSGIKPRIFSRLNEMARKGLIYRPNPAESGWKLTVQGERWIEETVLSKLKGEK